MSAQRAAYGRLGADPVARESQSGKPWATASFAVDLSDEQDGSAEWFGIVCFGKTAEVLCRHAKGDLISVSGRLQLNCWTDRDGNGQRRMQVIADTVISAKTARRGGRQGGAK